MQHIKYVLYEFQQHFYALRLLIKYLMMKIRTISSNFHH
jgi:hypothetical protein